MKKIFTLRNYLFAVIFLMNTNTAHAQTGISPAYAAILQTTLDSLREVNDVKGIYAAAYIPGKGIWKGVTGVSYGSHDIDTNMLFDIGSTTKTFVAAEIMKLIEEGYFGLDDTISTLLPPIENVTPDITVRQLLQHKSGLADYLNNEWQTAMFDDLTRMWYSPEAMDSFLTIPEGLPGGTWNYRNTNYVLLGMIAESIRGDSLHNILRNDFLTPLGLNNTYMEMFESYDNEIADNWATPTLDPDLAVNVSSYPHQALYSSTSFAGGFFSSAPDIATWGYNLYSGKVLADSSLAKMEEFTSVPGGYFNGYGLGCMRFIGDGETYYGHAGNYFGYAASMVYDPEDSICVAMLVNQDCLSPYIAMPLMKVALQNLALVTATNEYPAEIKIEVYPNPVNDQLHIRLPRNQEASIDLFDITGKLIYSNQQTAEHLSVDTKILDEGVYILKIKSGKDILTQKIIVKR